MKLSSGPIPILLIGGLTLILGTVAYGLILLRQNPQAFRIWIREDGLVEWLTFLVLIAMSAFFFIISFTFSRSAMRENTTTNQHCKF